MSILYTNARKFNYVSRDDQTNIPHVTEELCPDATFTKDRTKRHSDSE